MEEKKVGFFSGLPEREKVQIKLPSGRTITVLESTGREEKILSRLQDRTKFSQTVAAYLAGVTEDLDGEPGKIDVSKFEDMLVGDRIFILLHARLITHGSMIIHKNVCPTCQANCEHEIELQEIIDSMKPYPYQDQREFSIDFSGHVVHYELPTGRNETRMAKEKEVDINSKLRFIRMWEQTSEGKFPVSIDNLKSKQISALRLAIRENEAFIDTAVELQCLSCNSRTTVDIMGMANFLFPSLT